MAQAGWLGGSVGLGLLIPPPWTCAGEIYNRLVDETIRVVDGLGGNVRVSMALPYPLQETGFNAIDATRAFPVVLPWNNRPGFLAISARTVQPIYQLTDIDYDAFEQSLPGSVQTGHTLITVWGQRPSD